MATNEQSRSEEDIRAEREYLMWAGGGGGAAVTGVTTRPIAAAVADTDARSVAAVLDRKDKAVHTHEKKQAVTPLKKLAKSSSKQNTLQNSSAECPICLEKKPASSLVAVRCGHLFCSGCIKTWQESNDFCPVCRLSFVPTAAEKKGGGPVRQLSRGLSKLFGLEQQAAASSPSSPPPQAQGGAATVVARPQHQHQHQRQHQRQHQHQHQHQHQEAASATASADAAAAAAAEADAAAQRDYEMYMRQGGGGRMM